VIQQPCWRGSPDHLAIVIQYAVALRTGQKLKWQIPRKLSERSIFFEILAEVAAGRGVSSLQKTHRVTLATIRNRDMEPAYIDPISCILTALDKVVKTPQNRVAATVRPGPYIYPVTTKDLANVCEAIDSSFEGSSLTPMFVAARTSEKMSMKVRGMGRGMIVGPPNAQELITYHERSLLEECRRVRAIEAEKPLDVWRRSQTEPDG